jgi:hypothetical protein
VLRVVSLKLEDGAALGDACPPLDAAILAYSSARWLQRCARAYCLTAMSAEAFADDGTGVEIGSIDGTGVTASRGVEAADAAHPLLTDTLVAATEVAQAFSLLLGSTATMRELFSGSLASEGAWIGQADHWVASAVTDLAAFASRLVLLFKDPSTVVQRRWATTVGARASAVKTARLLLRVASEVAAQCVAASPGPLPSQKDLQAKLSNAFAVVFPTADKRPAAPLAS